MFREISLLRGLKQANIVTLHDIVHTKTSITLVFEYLDCDLKHYMETVRHLATIIREMKLVKLRLKPY